MIAHLLVTLAAYRWKNNTDDKNTRILFCSIIITAKEFTSILKSIIGLIINYISILASDVRVEIRGKTSSTQYGVQDTKW